MIEGMVAIVIIILTFAITYPIIDDAVNTLQNTAGSTTINMISSLYLPIMALMLIIAVLKYLRPERPSQFDYTGGY